MSECMVRMPYPKDCESCHLKTRNYFNGEFICAKTHTFLPASEKNNNCPIICALPEGHGPLVDWWDVKKELDQLFSVVVRDEHTGLQHKEYPIILEDNPIRIPIIIPATERSRE